MALTRESTLFKWLTIFFPRCLLRFIESNSDLSIGRYMSTYFYFELFFDYFAQ